MSYHPNGGFEVHGSTNNGLSGDISLGGRDQMFPPILKEPVIIREEEEWVLDFTQRHGDVAMEAQQHDEAIAWYSDALALNPTAPQALLIKRSKAYILKGLWKEALDDADEIIKLDPSCPFGYERKHVALHRARRYGDAIDAFEAMLSRMSASSDPEIRKCSPQYVKPQETEVKIRLAVQDAVRDLPRVLINTTSGRLFNQSEQAALFGSSSRNPPPMTNFKCFCNVVRDAGFNWAWSDNCCINKQDHAAHQEAVVAMFKWYEGSSLVIVFLRGVRSPSKRGDLMRSLWNTRAWTFQEYRAARVVRFYTEDWNRT
ncbi:hypothetical protein EV363DRAFT_1421156 [Boletus edulis]|nr:hypothetical protein EV363DRAFT_1421156 [Boletus edulis]